MKKEGRIKIVNKLSKTYLKKQERKELKAKDMKWSKDTKEKYGYKCAICGSTNFLNSHHVIPREFMTTRHMIENCVVLCCYCHKWNIKCSPHKNSLAFFVWMKRYRLEQYKLLEAIVDKNL